jgi:hypothetical protein
MRLGQLSITSTKLVTTLKSKSFNQSFFTLNNRAKKHSRLGAHSQWEDARNIAKSLSRVLLEDCVISSLTF